MTTIINTPGSSEGSESSIWTFLVVIVLLVAVGIFFVYLLPVLRSGGAAPQASAIDVKVHLPVVIASPTSTPAP